ncbi:hypothetical protein [Microcella alkalica]|uniref:hypothetical protein n=1 Tax=Microcella alkalica TaxID=355930 RepID=UPI00145E084E|nr:hypothetical protein [Microcella alkalica]
MKKQSLVLQFRQVWNSSVQETTKEIATMLAGLTIIALLGLAGAVSTAVVTAKDGYRRVPSLPQR